MATLIGLSIRVRMLRALPERFKVDIRVKAGSHQSEHQVNRQLNDKERVAGERCLHFAFCLKGYMLMLLSQPLWRIRICWKWCRTVWLLLVEEVK